MISPARLEAAVAKVKVVVGLPEAAKVYPVATVMLVAPPIALVADWIYNHPLEMLLKTTPALLGP